MIITHMMASHFMNQDGYRTKWHEQVEFTWEDNYLYTSTCTTEHVNISNLWSPWKWPSFGCMKRTHLRKNFHHVGCTFIVKIMGWSFLKRSHLLHKIPLIEIISHRNWSFNLIYSIDTTNREWRNLNEKRNCMEGKCRLWSSLSKEICSSNFLDIVLRFEVDHQLATCDPFSFTKSTSRISYP